MHDTCDVKHHVCCMRCWKFVRDFKGDFLGLLHFEIIGIDDLKGDHLLIVLFQKTNVFEVFNLITFPRDSIHIFATKARRNAFFYRRKDRHLLIGARQYAIFWIVC